MQRIIGGSFCHRFLKKIDTKFKLRPTSDKVRESLFNILGTSIINANVLDLFAGTGAIGIEAISRGAKNCIFIENNLNHFNLIKNNFELLEFEKDCKVYLKNTFLALKIIYHKQKKFDIIFLDPPYFFDFGKKTLHLISEYNILNKDGLVIWEHHKKEKTHEQIDNLKLKREYIYGNIVLSFYTLHKLENALI